MKTKHSLTTKRLVTDAVCAAMYFALALISLPLGAMTISVKSLAVIVGALLFGPLDGLIIGVLGEFLYQLLSYGLSVTTPLWILPSGLLGLVVGLYGMRKAFRPTALQAGIASLLGLLINTTVTTGVMWVDCQIYGYSFAAAYGAAIVWRYISDVIKVVVYSLAVPPLIKAIRKIR